MPDTTDRVIELLVEKHQLTRRAAAAMVTDVDEHKTESPYISEVNQARLVANSRAALQALASHLRPFFGALRASMTPPRRTESED